MSNLFYVEDIPDELWLPTHVHDVINTNHNVPVEMAAEGPPPLVDPAEEQRASIERLLELECAAAAAIWGKNHNAAVESSTELGGILGLKLNDKRKTEVYADPLNDEKRMKRTQSNKESARRSRGRKKVLLSELERQVRELKEEDAKLEERLNKARKKYDDAVVDNKILKANNETLRLKVQLLEITTPSTSQGPLLACNPHFTQHD